MFIGAVAPRWLFDMSGRSQTCLMASRTTAERLRSIVSLDSRVMRFCWMSVCHTRSIGIS